MATPHLAAKVFSRGDGSSAVAASAYRARVQMFDERTGQWHDYTGHRSKCLFEGIYAPKDAPDWARDRGQLWNHVETFEKHRRAELAREVEISLPHELTLEQNRWLLQDWVRENVTRKGLIADVAIHAPDPRGDQRNIHAHVLIVTRPLDGTEFTRTKKRFDSYAAKKAAWAESLASERASWEKLANRHLERHGHDARIDMGRAEDREATVHLGKAATALERDGVATQLGDLNRSAVAANENGRQRKREQAPAATAEQTPDLTAERIRAAEQEDERRRDAPKWGGFDAEIATALWQLSKTSPGLVGAIFVTPGGEAWRREDLAHRFALAPDPLAHDPTAERRAWVELLREAAGPRPDAPHVREGQAEARFRADELRDEARNATLDGNHDRAAGLREQAEGILGREGLVSDDSRPATARNDPTAERAAWAERLRSLADQPTHTPAPEPAETRQREAVAGGTEVPATTLAGAPSEATQRPSYEAGKSADGGKSAGPPENVAGDGGQQHERRFTLQAVIDAARDRLDALGQRLDAAFGRIRDVFLRRQEQPEAKRLEAQPDPRRSRSPVADEMLAASRDIGGGRSAEGLRQGLGHPHIPTPGRGLGL